MSPKYEEMSESYTRMKTARTNRTSNVCTDVKRHRHFVYASATEGKLSREEG